MWFNGLFNSQERRTRFEFTRFIEDKELVGVQAIKQGLIPFPSPRLVWRMISQQSWYCLRHRSKRESRDGERTSIKSSLDLLNCKNHPSYRYICIYISQSVGPICFSMASPPTIVLEKPACSTTLIIRILRISSPPPVMPTGEPQVMNLVGGLEHEFYFPIYWE